MEEDGDEGLLARIPHQVAALCDGATKTKTFNFHINCDKAYI